MKQTAKFGYKTRIYDVGDLGFGIQYNIAPEIEALDLRRTAKLCLSKPAIMLDALNSTDEMVVFLDADAFLVNRIDDLIHDDTYDVGVTHKGGKTKTYLNAGVLFFKQNDKSRKFLKMWIDAISKVEEDILTIDAPSRLGDNYYLNELVWSYIEKGQQIKNEVRTMSKIRVKFFDYQVYNNFKATTKLIPDSTKIIHMSHRSWYVFKSEVKRWSL